MAGLLRNFVLGVVFLAGCSGPNHPAAGYTYELHGEKGGVVTGAGADATAKVGNRSLSIKGGRLRVNDQDYGPLKNGDAVTVDQAGDVQVNGQKRTPQ
jgi:hypothetical protein